jgi:hypothetical protein
VQQLGQQQPGQQCQQQPLARTTHSHTESAYAGYAPNTQPLVVEPASSLAATSTTTTSSV